jgi:hypothetical protein
MFAPVYEKAAAAHPDIVFGKVDTEAEQPLVAAAHITSRPRSPSSRRARDGRLLTTTLDRPYDEAVASEPSMPTTPGTGSLRPWPRWTPPSE